MEDIQTMLIYVCTLQEHDDDGMSASGSCSYRRRIRGGGALIATFIFIYSMMAGSTAGAPVFVRTAFT